MRQKERAIDRAQFLSFRAPLPFVRRQEKEVLDEKRSASLCVFEHARRFKFLPSIDLNAIKCVFLFEEHVLNVQELCETSACAICMLC